MCYFHSPVSTSQSWSQADHCWLLAPSWCLAGITYVYQKDFAALSARSGFESFFGVHFSCFGWLLGGWLTRIVICASERQEDTCLVWCPFSIEIAMIGLQHSQQDATWDVFMFSGFFVKGEWGVALVSLRQIYLPARDTFWSLGAFCQVLRDDVTSLYTQGSISRLRWFARWWSPLSKQGHIIRCEEAARKVLVIEVILTA